MEQAESLISGEESDAPSTSSNGSLHGVRRNQQPSRHARQRHQLLSDDDDDAGVEAEPGGQIDSGSDIIEDPDEEDDADFDAPPDTKRQRNDAVPAEQRAAKAPGAKNDISAYFRKLPLGELPQLGNLQSGLGMLTN